MRNSKMFPMEKTDSIPCPYQGKLRPIHPEACAWHCELLDPECETQNCERYKDAERKIRNQGIK
jgi:hypothetical protein